ncbi:ATP-binding protein [Archangium lansingense]|uniref:histidine kinase n=1 Tax=Archangium lansingense TaxID=2995310 RepID=A0ABT4A1J2_9BACT|nr:ATP-binding protein [Archangium lansinium]MCY1075507.1 ATP-binding protein [Archangium lansinium]
MMKRPRRSSTGERPGHLPRLPPLPPLPPLRISIPLVLLLFAATLGILDLRQNSSLASRRVEEDSIHELSRLLNEKQEHLELLLRLSELERVRESVASLGSDTHVKSALIFDDAGKVLASTRRAEIGKQARELYPELFTREAKQRAHQTRENLIPSIQVTPDRQALVAWFPVMSPPSPKHLTPSAVWVLTVERDLTSLKARAHNQVRMTVVQRSGLLAVLAGMLWLFFHFALTRRVDRLVTTARRFAVRDWEARSELSGSDELALVGRAFDEMGEQLRATLTQLEESESQVRLLLDSAAEGIFGLDLDGRTTLVNRSAAQMLGYSDAQELLGLNAHETWHYAHADGSAYPESECPILQALRIDAKNHVERDFLWRKDGTRLAVEYWSYPIHQRGQRIGAVATFVDITARQRAEDAQRFLIDVSTQLAELLDEKSTLERVARLAIPQLGQWCVIDMVDDEGLIHRVAEVHQDPARQELLRELAKHPPPSGNTLQPTAHVLSTGRPILGDEATQALLHTGKSGAAYTELLQRLGTRTAIALPVTVRGQTLAALLLVSDTPGFQYGPLELELAEELARRASVAMDNARLYHQSLEAVRLREDFLSVASHELNTPLTPLRLHLQTIRRALAPSHEGDSSTLLLPKVDKALGQVKRLSQLVNDLLDVSRLSAGRLHLQLEEVDLEALTRELAERFSEQATAAGCPLLVTSEGPTVGHWDRTRLEQILTNLITNALKYGVGKPVEFHVASSEGRARWSIRDHGIGIAAKDLERIFGRFERAVSTRQYGGLGLGLYISRAIVRALGGDIHVESQPGTGALFTVELPLEPAWDAQGPETPSRDMTGRGPPMSGP